MHLAKLWHFINIFHKLNQNFLNICVGVVDLIKIRMRVTGTDKLILTVAVEFFVMNIFYIVLGFVKNM